MATNAPAAVSYERHLLREKARQQRLQQGGQHTQLTDRMSLHQPLEKQLAVGVKKQLAVGMEKQLAVGVEKQLVLAEVHPVPSKQPETESVKSAQTVPVATTTPLNTPFAQVQQPVPPRP